MYLCAQSPCNAFCSIQALPWDCIWLMGKAAIQRGLLYWTSSFGTIKVSAIRIKLLCARSRAFPVCGSGRNTPRDRAASGILCQHEASFCGAAEHTAALIAKRQATKRGFLLHLPLPPGHGPAVPGQSSHCPVRELRSVKMRTHCCRVVGLSLKAWGGWYLLL